MTPVTFWFDPLSPYACLAFERLPHALEACSYAVRYRPVLTPALLAHWGQLGPAEIAPKRAWTYRQVTWIARVQGSALQLPAAHPFNPLPLLRLLVACAFDGEPNRHQCEQAFAHVWHCGLAADDPQRLEALTARLAPVLDPNGDAVKRMLRRHTDEAIARGVFGVPTLELPGADPGAAPRLFFGADSLDMAASCLRGDPWFESEWESVATRPIGAERKR